MEYSGDDIKKRKDDIRNNILKSFNIDIEKAVAPIGEIRKWSDGTYKKIERGKWVKITNGKEKAIASSTMIRKINEEVKNKQNQWEHIKGDFENSLNCKYTRGTTSYKLFFERAWCDEIQKNKFVQRIREEQKDLHDEIKEIKTSIENDKKKSREEKIGKREYGVDDLSKLLNEFFNLFYSVKEKIPRYTSANIIIPQVTIDDYYLDTETVFKSILTGKESWKDIDDKWDTMKKSGKYIWHKSPKSESEYLIDNEIGNIYRFSDHWGRVASCTWDISSKNSNVWDIAKSNIKEFKRKETSNYFNPEYREKMLKAAKIVLPKLNKLSKENSEFYLTTEAKLKIRNFADKIFDNYLHESALLSIEEVSKLKKKYDSI
jgi:hypothetical protein